MDDDRFIEIMGLFGPTLSRLTYALETIAGAQKAMAQLQIRNYTANHFASPSYNEVMLTPAQCQEPCCRREA
ncbi:hypothetical protein LCGC14_2879690 [marine sediment metagenome]|uniref:Uncharacterized protein n=1 Tax=marine sediment metagenome TaxID=412755 RepID=A0A0F9ARM6_9ZZZZ